jgi:hypothetical protein
MTTIDILIWYSLEEWKNIGSHRNFNMIHWSSQLYLLAMECSEKIPLNLKVFEQESLESYGINWNQDKSAVICCWYSWMNFAHPRYYRTVFCFMISSKHFFLLYRHATLAMKWNLLKRLSTCIVFSPVKVVE